MEEAIKEKLRNALTEPIEKECQVLYILAEIRKLLDWGKKEFPVLRFYSNWALHIEIEKTGAVNGILKKIEETIRKGKYEIETVLNFIDFEEFRKEIKKFLEDLNLPYDLFTSYKNWGNFRRLFVDILTDCSLKPKHGGIEYFSFRKPNTYPSEINFEIKLRDKKEPLFGGFSFLTPDNWPEENY